MALTNKTRPLLQKLRRDPIAKASFDKVVAEGCDRKTLTSFLLLLAGPGEHRKDWYRMDSFPPDKMRRYPDQLRQHAEDMEALNKAICSSPIYREVISHAHKLPNCEALPPDWFDRAFRDIPNRLRQYASVIAWIEKAVEGVATRAAKSGRAKVKGAELVYYVHLATGGPHYEDVANILNSACPERFGDVDAQTLGRFYRRSDYSRKIKQAKASAFRANLLRPRST